MRLMISLGTIQHETEKNCKRSLELKKSECPYEGIKRCNNDGYMVDCITGARWKKKQKT